MIVRDPEKRATLNEVMSDVWYQQFDDDDDQDIEQIKNISKDDHEIIIRQMIDGNIADKDAILKSLDENQYNHITATYNLLAEKILYDDNHEHIHKRPKRSLQPTNDPFIEQIGVFMTPSVK